MAGDQTPVLESGSRSRARAGWDRVGAQGRWKVAGLAAGVVVVVAVSLAVAFGGSRSGAPAAAPSVAVGHGVAGGPSATATFGTGSGSIGSAGGNGGGSLSSAGSAVGGSTAGAPAASLPAPAGPPAGVVSLVAPKVVETGSVDLTIGHGSLSRVVNAITSQVAADSGLVAHSDTSTNDGVASANLTLRVPNADFPAFVDAIDKLGKVTTSTTAGDDVTSQYVDLQSRIQALEASRGQYLTIMAKANSVGDVLAVQSQLDNIQSQLEQLQGQMNVLSDQTTYATLTVAMIEAMPGGQPPPPRPENGIVKAWHHATSGFLAGVDWLVAAAGPLAFALLLVLGLAAIGRVGWGLIRRRRSAIGRADVAPGP